MPTNPLTPRQTAMRLLEHMEEDAGYGDIIRQMRILQDIDQTMSDADVAASPSESAVHQARSIALGSWKSLADRSKDARSPSRGGPSQDMRGSDKAFPDDLLDSLLRRAAWIH